MHKLQISQVNDGIVKNFQTKKFWNKAKREHYYRYNGIRRKQRAGWYT